MRRPPLLIIKQECTCAITVDHGDSALHAHCVHPLGLGHDAAACNLRGGGRGGLCACVCVGARASMSSCVCHTHMYTHTEYEFNLPPHTHTYTHTHTHSDTHLDEADDLGAGAQHPSTHIDEVDGGACA